ncbi:toll/interleukin-1 receptor domain-containing protein [Methylobacterium sp. JK268]
MRARAPTRITKPAVGKAALGPRRAPKAPAATPAKTEKPEVRIFVSYSHQDGDVRARLEIHLAPLKRERVETWFDGGLDAGDKLDTGIARAMRDAHVFVAMLSPDYLARPW